MLSRCAKPSPFPKNKINIILVLFVRGELSRGLKMFGKTVIIKRGTKEVYSMELTVHWDCASNMALLVQRKTERYQGLASAIEENGYKCFNTSLEIEKGSDQSEELGRPQSPVPGYEDQED